VPVVDDEEHQTLINKWHRGKHDICKYCIHIGSKSVPSNNTVVSQQHVVIMSGRLNIIGHNRVIQYYYKTIPILIIYFSCLLKPSKWDNFVYLHVIIAAAFVWSLNVSLTVFKYNIYRRIIIQTSTVFHWKYFQMSILHMLYCNRL